MENKEMKTEIRHFTDELPGHDSYGYPWEQVVNAYLESGYKKEDKQCEVKVYGTEYKVLKRGEVTAFYDADGNTLFDVENGRLEREYKRLMDNIKETGSEDGNEDVVKEKNADMAEKKADTETGKTAEEEQGKDDAKKNTDTEAEDTKSVKELAKEKLEQELKSAKDKAFAKAVIGYLLERCAEDDGLAQDVIQEHKTWQKCFDYIRSQAQKQSKEGYAFINDEVVYEWSEDYYHKDDKAEEEKKAGEEAERKKKRAKTAAPVKSGTKGNTGKKSEPSPEKKRG